MLGCGVPWWVWANSSLLSSLFFLIRFFCLPGTVCCLLAVSGGCARICALGVEAARNVMPLSVHRLSGLPSPPRADSDPPTRFVNKGTKWVAQHSASPGIFVLYHGRARKQKNREGREIVRGGCHNVCQWEMSEGSSDPTGGESDGILADPRRRRRCKSLAARLLQTQRCMRGGGRSCRSLTFIFSPVPSPHALEMVGLRGREGSGACSGGWVGVCVVGG